MRSLRIGTCFAMSLLLTTIASAQTPVGSNFTYQGQLKNSGDPVNGLYDVRFRLFDAPTGGNQIGSTICRDNVLMSEGVFSASLDFGAAAFAGDARWVEIAVRPDATSGNCGSGAYTVMSTRQPLTAAPYALFALNDANWTRNGTRITNSGGTNFVGINRNSAVTAAEYFGVQAPVSSGYGGMYIRTDGATGLPFYGYRCGDSGEIGWTYLDGSTGDWHLYVDGDRITATDSGQVGIGTTAPEVKLHVEGGTDTSLGGGGFLVLGSTTGTNLSIDNNEIMARNNGAESTLSLNYQGGATYLGGILQVTSGFTTHKAVVEHTNNNTLRLVGPGGSFGYDNAINFGDAEYVYLWEDSDDNFTIHAVGGAGGRLRVQADTIVWNATKPATVKLDDQTQVRMYAEEATEVMFTDYGRARLVNGSVHIDLDAAFMQTVTINDDNPMSVFVQLEGDCNGVFVTNMTGSGFDVVELQNGRSNAPFSYRVVAHRKLYENLRMATEEEDKAANRRMRQIMWPEEITAMTYAEKPIAPTSQTQSAPPGSVQPESPQSQPQSGSASRDQ